MFKNKILFAVFFVGVNSSHRALSQNDNAIQSDLWGFNRSSGRPMLEWDVNRINELLNGAAHETAPTAEWNGGRPENPGDAVAIWVELLQEQNANLQRYINVLQNQVMLNQIWAAMNLRPNRAAVGAPRGS